MTISTQNNKTTLVGNGSNKTFAFTFKIFATSDVAVYVDDVLTTTGFTVSGLDNDSGGNIVFAVAPASSKTITMIRSIEYTQEADYVEGDPFSPDVHERQLDRQVMMNQQSKEVIDRSIQMPASETNGVILPSSASRASRVLSFDSSGDLEAGPLTQDVQAVADNATNINAVAANATNINSAVANSSNINSAVANAANINSAAGNSANITAAVANETNINAAVANATNINAAVANETNITATADNQSNINTVAGIAANVNSVVANETNINATVANAANINTVAGISTAVTNVNNIASDVSAVNTNVGNITAVSTNSVNVNLVANNIGEISDVATALASLDELTDPDGWTNSEDTWVYVNANKFKIVDLDRSTQLQAGTKIQLTNSTVKYRYVASVAVVVGVSTTDTQVTLLANAGTALANSAITLPKYSHQDTPIGFPDWGSGDQNSALAVEVAANVAKLAGIEVGATADQTNVSGTAATVTNAAQPAITSVGVLTSLAVRGGGDIETNTAVGTNALDANTTGASNTATGYNSLANNTTGYNNVATGKSALNDNTTGHSNIASGVTTLGSNTTGEKNTASGTTAMANNTTGYNNVATGYSALRDNTTGYGNVAYGYDALHFNTTGNTNTGVGYLSLQDTTTGGANSALGSYSLRNNTTGDYNVALGNDTLNVNTTGTTNTAVGVSAMRENTTGGYNTALGGNVLYNNTTASLNAAVGYFAMNSTTTGSWNAALGTYALRYNTSGIYNTAIGYSALRDNTTGTRNTAIGQGAMQSETTASYNTAVGESAMTALTTGTRNTSLGRYTSYTTTTGNYNTCIGYGTRPTYATDSYAIGIGYNISAGGGHCTIGSGGSDIRTAHGVAAWGTVSDERYKKNITDATAGLDFVNALRPRTWNYRELGDLPETFSSYEEGSAEVFKNTKTNHGFIAQEVKAVIDADEGIKDGFVLWGERDDGSQELAEAALIPVLVKAIQELTARIKTLEEG